MSQSDCPVYLPSCKFETQSQIFSRQTFIIKKSFDITTFRGHFKVVVAFYFESHTYNYLVNGRWALISPNIITRTIILGRREYLLHHLVKQIDPQLATVIGQS